MLRRIKVVSESTDLVPVLRAFDSDVKRDVFRKVADAAVPGSAIEAEFGEPGLEALNFFEKTKLVTTEWASVNGKTEKAYRSYYTAFQINVSCSSQEMTEILQAALMPEPEFRRFEDELLALVGTEGYSARAIVEKFGVTIVRLKSLLKRSSRVELRGHIVKKIE